MESKHDKENGIHINVTKDMGYKKYHYSHKIGTSIEFGGEYFGGDIAKRLTDCVREMPAGSKVTLSSMHKDDTYKYRQEICLTDEELREIARRIEETRNDLKIVLIPVA